MSQIGFTPIQLYRSATPGAVPLAADLAPGELAINTADQKLFFENASGTVVASLPFNTTGVLDVANGGTGASTLTANYILKGNGTSAVSSSVLYENSGYLGIGTTGPTVLFDAQQTLNGSGGISYTNLSTGASSAASITAEAGGSYLTLNVTRATGVVQFRGVTATTLNQDFNTQIFRSTGATEYMRITSAGAVLVGTATTPGSPNARIVAGGTSDAGIQLASTSGGGALILAPNGAGTAFYTYTGAVGSESYTERMRIDTSGNVGIGTSAPVGRLMVAAADTSNTIGSATASINITNTDAGAFGRTANLNFTLDDGNLSTRRLATISAVYTGFGGGGTEGALAFATQFNGSLSERMRISSAGNVGIGTTAPGYKLDVSATGNISGQFKTSGSINALFLADAGTTAETLYVGTVGNDFRVVTSSNERMRVTSAGAVAIGTATPGGGLKLDVSGNGRFIGNLDVYNVSGGPVNSGFLNFGSGALSNAAAIYSQTLSGTAGDLILATAQTGTGTITERVRVNSSGLVGIGTSAPSAQLTVIPTSNPANATGTLQTAIGEATNNSAYQMRMGYYLGNTYQGVINTLAGGVGADLLLNPSGGGVVIGSNLPRSALNISRTGSTASVEASASIVLTNRSTAINGTIMGGIFANTFRDVSDPHYSAGIWFTRNQAAGNAASSSDIVFATITPYNEVNVMPTERMRITPAGRVGIGTSAPNAEVVISGAGDAGTVAGYRNTLYLKNSNPSSNQSNAIVFGSNGTASPCSIINDINADGTGINRLYVFAGSGGGVYLDNGATAWASASDERSKDIIEPILNAVQKVGMLRAVIGKYKTDAEGTRRSFLIAQDVQAVLPEAVNVGTDEQQTLGVAYTDTIPLLVAAIKELTARVAQLEGK